MSQQAIDFGSFPNDPSADPIRAAFAKVQNNFTELYSVTFATGVVSLTAGAGLATSSRTGNIVISANIPNVTIQTSSSLTVGVGAPATTTTATINYGNTPFYIGLASTISTTNVVATSLTGTLTTAAQPNITSVGNLTVLNVISSITAANFYGNFIGTQFTGTFTAPGSNTQILFNQQGNINAAAYLNYTGTNLTMTGNIIATSNVNAGNANLGNTVTANYYYGNFLGPASNSSTVTSSAQPNIT